MKLDAEGEEGAQRLAVAVEMHEGRRALGGGKRTARTRLPSSARSSSSVAPGGTSGPASCGAGKSACR